MKVKLGTRLDYTGRTGSPFALPHWRPSVPRFHGEELILEGGILGRVDDMVIIRGVNLSQ